MCLPCHEAGQGRDAYRLGIAKFRLAGIRAHAKTMGHAKSVEARRQRERAHDHGCEHIDRQGEVRTCSNDKVVAQGSSPASSAIICARVLVETRGSFSDCKSWVESAETAGSSTIVCDRKSAQKRVQALASFELGVTRAIASAAQFPSGSGRVWTRVSD